MPPEGSNSKKPNTDKPDFGAVPLPDPTPIRSPYAPVGGTLGDIANSVAEEERATAAPQSMPLPSPGVVGEGLNRVASAVPAASTGASENPTTAAPAIKLKRKKSPVIIAAILLLIAIIGIVLFIIIVNSSANAPASNNTTPSNKPFYGDGNFAIMSDEGGTKRYAIYSQDGKAITDFIYSDISDVFVADSALARRDGEYGIIDRNGKEIVPFGEYDKITAYGGLYGAEKDDQRILLNRRGEKVVEYEKENIGNHLDIYGGNDAAYTVYGEGGHYIIYDPFGAKAGEFDSTISPTVSSPDIGIEGSSTIIVYSDGVIVLDDRGNELRRVKKSISAKTYGIFVSKTRNVVGLSTVNEPLIKGLGTIVAPEDRRNNALIIGENYYDYNYKTCAGLYYDDSYVAADEDGFVLCIRGDDSYPIDPVGVVSQNTYSYSTASYRAQSLHGGTDLIYPIGLNTYAIKPDDNSYGIFYKGKKVGNLLNSKKESVNKDKFTKTSTSISYNLLGMGDGYIVQRINRNVVYQYTDKNLSTLKRQSQKESGEIMFLNQKGETICTIGEGDYVGIATRSTSPTGQNVDAISATNITGMVSGRALIRSIDSAEKDEGGYRLVDNRCRVVSPDEYSSLTRIGDFTILTQKDKNTYIHTLLDDGGKTLASFSEVAKRPSPDVIKYLDAFNVFHSDKDYYLLGYGKVLHKIDKYCTAGARVRWTNDYLEYETGPASSACGIDNAKSVHYYFNKSGQLFYEWSEEDPPKGK